MDPSLAEVVRGESRLLLADQLRRGKSIRLTLASASMAPTLAHGEKVEVAPIPSGGPRVDDLVLTARDRAWVIHRVRALSPGTGGPGLLVTRGDAGLRTDPPVAAAEALGIVAGRWRNGALEPIPDPPIRSLDAGLLQASFTVSPALVRWAERLGWNRFYRCAEQEGLLPLIAWGWTVKRGAERMPAALAARFNQAYHFQLSRNTLFLMEIRRVLDALAGLPVIPLKGAFLAERVYCNPALRPFSDFDLLVPPADVPAVCQRLQTAGYMLPTCSVPSVTPFINSLVAKPRSAGLPIHLHWSLLNTSRPEHLATTLDLAAVWERARPGELGELALAPEDLLIHLAEHALRHSFDRLLWLRDIAAALGHCESRLDWDLLIQRAGESGLAAALYQSLFYLSRMMPVHVPETVLEKLAPGSGDFGQRLFRKLARRGRRLPEMGLLVHLSQAGGLRARARFVYRLFYPGANCAGPCHDTSDPRRGIKRAGRGLRYAVRVLAGWGRGIGSVEFAATWPRVRAAARIERYDPTV